MQFGRETFAVRFQELFVLSILKPVMSPHMLLTSRLKTLVQCSSHEIFTSVPGAGAACGCVPSSPPCHFALLRATIPSLRPAYRRRFLPNRPAPGERTFSQSNCDLPDTCSAKTP